jgi:hypothetical protein
MTIFVIGRRDHARREWQRRIRGILKAELKRRHVSYAELPEKLHTIGVKGEF